MMSIQSFVIAAAAILGWPAVDVPAFAAALALTATPAPAAAPVLTAAPAPAAALSPASAQVPTICEAGSAKGSPAGTRTGAVEPMVHITGDVARPITLGAAELEGLPRRRVRVDDREGPAEFEGVPLLEILRVAGVPVESLRGAQAATVVIAEARDGYRAAYSLAELDENFSGRLFILADRRGEATLGEGEGPLRIVGQGESRRSRWIREVSCLRVVTY